MDIPPTCLILTESCHLCSWGSHSWSLYPAPCLSAPCILFLVEQEKYILSRHLVSGSCLTSLFLEQLQIFPCSPPLLCYLSTSVDTHMCACSIVPLYVLIRMSGTALVPLIQSSFILLFIPLSQNLISCRIKFIPLVGSSAGNEMRYNEHLSRSIFHLPMKQLWSVFIKIQTVLNGGEE